MGDGGVWVIFDCIWVYIGVGGVFLYIREETGNG